MRTALILLAAVFAGGVVAALTYLSSANGAGAVLAGIAAGAVSAKGFHELIGS
ncbi:hypothetical protein OHB49_45680 (plasmid) [Streptomyces sp. NBC_01717]|uniref:hypothetical protein n=1 Tax=Streptomyces sp. NBC_01717 TaxID=2975918 RepID=UPI002E37B116|nr:hypothetical protein [Streptomyces sp. NBC_01717]